jgi:hypothetical protein
MGFAKYMEADLSRYHRATVVRAREHERLKPLADQRQGTAPITKQGMKRISEQNHTNRMKDFTLAETIRIR